MIPDKATLEAQLRFLDKDSKSLKAAVDERNREIVQIDARKALLTEEIFRNSGAIVYVERFTQEIRRQLDELAKAAAMEAAAESAKAALAAAVPTVPPAVTA